MRRTRRNAIKLTGGAGLYAALAAMGLLKPALAEWNKAAFDQKKIEDTLKALGAGNAAASSDINIIAPEIAENGAVVPIHVVSKLKVQSLAIMIEKNPNMLAAIYTLPPGTIADVQTRVKMAQTSDVVVLVKADDKFFIAKKEIKVTLGGCGG